MHESDPFEVTAAERRPGGIGRRVVIAVVVVAGAAGVAVGATVVASAATSPATTQPGSTSTTTPGPDDGARSGMGGRFHGSFAGPAGGSFGLDPRTGAVVHGQYTVKGPNGYETIDVRNGTAADVTNTSGSTWSLTVKSADSTSATFTVDGSTSVNGGESGIGSVKSGDTVEVIATTSGSKATATRITDQTTLQANGKSWLPRRPPVPGATQPSAGWPSPPATGTT
ncbi:MAG TPA: hypothetical protein VNC61_03870 [Acidimicrobiales bacterium]|nr:hypothetical protein [Acidimicrobiales bacterium]